MRSGDEMLALILGFAGQDERVRAVILNGSRANPEARGDDLQDFDIVYAVTALEDFVADRSWIGYFGDILIMQTPDDSELFPSEGGAGFAFLMLFADGNRIDLTFYPVDQLRDIRKDSLSVLLLDKDARMEPFPLPSERDYLTLPPTAGQFAGCCNEFWWVCTYVGKGLKRHELAYAKAMYDGPVREMLHLMLCWQIGIRTAFSANPGKYGKYFEKYLEPAEWRALVNTYADGDYRNMWQGLFVMCGLFRDAALQVAGHFQYDYRHDDDRRVTAYLETLQSS